MNPFICFVLFVQNSPMRNFQSIPEKVNLNKHDAHLDTKGETEMCVFQSKKVGFEMLITEF